MLEAMPGLVNWGRHPGYHLSRLGGSLGWRFQGVRGWASSFMNGPLGSSKC